MPYIITNGEKFVYYDPTRPGQYIFEEHELAGVIERLQGDSGPPLFVYELAGKRRLPTAVSVPFKSLSALLDYVQRDEERDFQEKEEPQDHIYHHIRVLQKALDSDGY